MILDDESLIVEGISAAVDWDALGLTLAGVAYNGLDGRDLVDSVRPDIVISDIVMPGLSGLELLAHCRTAGIPSQFIILSAHDDFGYAQQALRQQASDYILKPIDPEKLLRAIGKAMETIERAEAMDARMAKLEHSVRAVEPIASSALLLDVARMGMETLDASHQAIVREKYPEAGVVACVRLFNLPVGEKPVILAGLVRALDGAFAAEGLHAIRGGAESMQVYVFPEASMQRAQAARTHVADAIRLCGDALFQAGGVVCVGAVSDAYQSLDALHARYLDSVRALSLGFFQDMPHVFMESAEEAGELPVFDCNRPIFQLQHGNMAEMIAEHEQVQKGLRQLRDRDFAVYTFHELYRRATSVASKAGMVQKPVISNGLENENFAIRAQKNLRYFQDICAYIHKGQSVLGRLKLMVDERYADSGFGLAAAADRLGVSGAHLSRLFKKETGMNFVDYLVGKRIDRAKYLLRMTNMKNSDIAVAVGFEDDHYFRQVFKKKCGVTPRAYRDETSP